MHVLSIQIQVQLHVIIGDALVRCIKVVQEDMLCKEHSHQTHLKTYCYYYYFVLPKVQSKPEHMDYALPRCRFQIEMYSICSIS